LKSRQGRRPRLSATPLPWAACLPAWNWLDKQTGPKARLSAIPPERSIQFMFPGPSPFPPGNALNSRRGRRTHLSAIPPPPKHCIPFLFPGLDPKPPGIALTSRRGRRSLLAPSGFSWLFLAGRDPAQGK
jgi:hypothetical protein